jgi:hypothetical protein
MTFLRTNWTSRSRGVLQGFAVCQKNAQTITVRTAEYAGDVAGAIKSGSTKQVLSETLEATSSQKVGISTRLKELRSARKGDCK